MKLPERVVVDASALVDPAIGNEPAPAVAARLRGTELPAPSHLDAEVLSALGRLQRAGHLSARQEATRITRPAAAPCERHPLAPLPSGALRRRHRLRVADALCAEPAEQLPAILITTDEGAAAPPAAELVTGRP